MSLLACDRIGRSFGGLHAVREVSLSFDRGQVHAIIGPNGAGKTTLINLLSGDLRPSRGALLVQGRAVTGAKPHRVARLGIGRSYQRTNIFRDFTVWENTFLAAQATRPSAFRFIRRAERAPGLAERIERALSLAGLSALAERPARLLSHGAQRQLEIAMLLATDPQVLLLDEPMAGMGPEESQSVVDLIRMLRQDHAIVLIEHDMDAVFAVADQISVMVEGAVLASGPPDAIRTDPAVRKAYLGDDHG